MSANETYTVVFRTGSIVQDHLIRAKDIVKAAKKAEQMTGFEKEFPGWTVYSITRGVTS